MDDLRMVGNCHHDVYTKEGFSRLPIAAYTDINRLYYGKEALCIHCLTEFVTVYYSLTDVVPHEEITNAG